MLESPYRAYASSLKNVFAAKPTSKPAQRVRSAKGDRHTNTREGADTLVFKNTPLFKLKC